ncbi:MAG: phosphatase PAP2 family protein [SAR202 cluster bacterium]|nr:phosphatase PAP2 family protein [SAR202 cluster bacterium]
MHRGIVLELASTSPVRRINGVDMLRAEVHFRLHSLGRWRDPALEVALYLGAYLVYLGMRRGFASDPAAAALDNAQQLMALERRLGIFWEPAWQSWWVENVPALVKTLNWFYIVTYWPVILAAAVALYLSNRPLYCRYRNVMVASLTLALAVFALFPVAPPLKLTEHFTDTVQQFGPSLYGGPQMAPFYNAYAAMPSLHFTWTIILGVMFLQLLQGWQRWLALAYPGLTLAAIIITGNHFLLDALAGGVLALAGFAAADRMPGHPKAGSLAHNAGQRGDPE